MNLWESLLEVLKEQTKVYLQLNDLLETKPKTIIESRLSALEEIVAKEAVLVQQITVLEEKRLAIITELGQKLSLAAADLTLEQWKEYLPEEYRDDYQEIKTKLGQTLRKASLLNKQNQELLESSLQYIDFSLDMLAGLPSSPVYAQPGKEKENPKLNRSIFDQKV